MKYTLKDLTGISYLFDATAKTISISGLDYVLEKSNILAVINATTNQVMARIENPTLSISDITGNVLTLVCDMTGMQNTDDLEIWFELPPMTVKVIDEAGNDITQQIHDIQDALLHLTNTIGFLPSVRGILNDLRVSIIGGTTAVTGTLTGVTTVATVSTLGNQSSQGGYNSAPLVPSAQNIVAITQVLQGISFS